MESTESQRVYAVDDSTFDTPLLANVPRENWPEVLMLAVREELSAGQAIFHQDDPPGDLVVLLSGTVNVVVRGRAGDIPLAELGAGAVIGEMSFLLDSARSATVRTKSPTSILRFSHNAFQQLLDTQSPTAFQVLYNVARSLASRLNATDERVRELSVPGPVSQPEVVRVRRAILADPD